MRVQVETPFHSFSGRVVNLIDGDDVEGTFKMVDDDDGATLIVHGWRCDVTVIPACAGIKARHPLSNMP